MWPAVREAARRILRLDGITLHLPSRLMDQADELVVRISDAQPSRLTFPSMLSREREWVDAFEFNLDGGDLDHIIRLGTEEPGRTTCWIPLSVDLAWQVVLEACFELLDAGYPGCIGCGGPNSEAPWDELASRKKWRSGT